MTTGKRIGLALGGGGARGLAHIPMLEVFDEMGLKPSIIAGSSMGALIGACYAAGMSGKDLRLHAETLLSDRITFARHVFGARKVKPFDLLSLKGFASLHLSGERLADVALPDHLPKLIEDTPIPLKIVATDYERMCEVVLTSGSIVTAVGASIAIPGLIAAPLIDGRIHVDGGVTNPVPFDKVYDDADIIVAVDVSARPKPVQGVGTNLDVAIGSMLIMFYQIAEMRRALNPPDIYIRPDTDSIATGDFFRVKEIFSQCVPAQERLRRALEAELA